MLLRLFTSGTTGTLKAAEHTPGDLCRGRPQCADQPGRPGARRDHAPRRLDDPRQRHLRPALLAARRHGGDPARLRARLPIRGDRALAADGAQPGADHAADAVPAARRSTTPISPRSRPSSTAPRRCRGRCSSEALGAVGPGLRPILRPDRSAARDLPRSARQDHVGATPERLLSCGRPSVECEVRLVDEDGEDAPPGEPGEIVLRAPFVMKGYTRSGADRQAFLPGGWLRTRDVGRFDEEGYLTLVDRTSDMIVTGGYNVYPREVEDVLAAHPAVAQVAVVGLPDEIWGEAVTAFVVAARRRGGGRSRADRLRPRPSRRLQGAQVGALRRRDPAEPGRQAAAPGAARAVLGRAGSGGYERASSSATARSTTVIIDRPERRNAVDPATAQALREAFDAFEADETRRGRGADRRRRPFLRRLRPQGGGRRRRRTTIRSARGRWGRPGGCSPSR